MAVRDLIRLSLASALAACSGGQAQENDMPAASDFSSAIVLRDAGECRFDPLTEHAFEGLMLIGGPEDGVKSAPVVALSEARLTPRLVQGAMANVPEVREYRGEVTLPPGSTWHGLKIERMWVEFISPPETDSLYRRGIHFAAEPRAVRATLAAQGAEVPLKPDWRELGEYAGFTAGTCGGAISIEEGNGGASLVCERGC